MTKIQAHVTPSFRPELDDTQLQKVVGGADRTPIAAGPEKRTPIAQGPLVWVGVAWVPGWKN
ncbi:hypothetical protein Q3C01_14940 [Bradyrhizobium sp. UFLA05-109]